MASSSVPEEYRHVPDIGIDQIEFSYRLIFCDYLFDAGSLFRPRVYALKRKVLEFLIWFNEVYVRSQ